MFQWGYLDKVVNIVDDPFRWDDEVGDGAWLVLDGSFLFVVVDQVHIVGEKGS